MHIAQLRPAAASDLTELRQDLQQRRALTTHTIYECPSCGDRLVGERRCSACGFLCRSLGWAATARIATRRSCSLRYWTTTVERTAVYSLDSIGGAGKCRPVSTGLGQTCGLPTVPHPRLRRRFPSAGRGPAPTPAGDAADIVSPPGVLFPVRQWSEPRCLSLVVRQYGRTN